MAAEDVMLAHVDIVGGEFASLVDPECALEDMSEVWRDVIGSCGDSRVVGKGGISIGC